MFSGKVNLVICQCLSGVNKFKFVIAFSKQKKSFRINLSFFYHFPNYHLKYQILSTTSQSAQTVIGINNKAVFRHFEIVCLIPKRNPKDPLGAKHTIIFYSMNNNE